MDYLKSFFINNYIYFIFGGILIVLALIGYIVDSSKEKKVRKEKEQRKVETTNIPAFNPSVRLGDNGNDKNIDNHSKIS